MKISSPEIYTLNLAQVAALLGVDDDQLISFKIRPIDVFPASQDDDYFDRYIDKNEYQNIRTHLKKDVLVQEELINGGLTQCYANQADEHYLFVEHESGPEIIASMALLTASLSLSKSVVELIMVVIKRIDEANAKKSKDLEHEEKDGRVYFAQAISIEKRTKQTTTTERFIKLPIAPGKVTEQEIFNVLASL